MVKKETKYSKVRRFDGGRPFYLRSRFLNKSTAQNDAETARKIYKARVVKEISPSGKYKGKVVWSVYQSRKPKVSYTKKRG